MRSLRQSQRNLNKLFPALSRSSLTVYELLKLLEAIRSRKIDKEESNAEVKQQRIKSPGALVDAGK